METQLLARIFIDFQQYYKIIIVIIITVDERSLSRIVLEKRSVFSNIENSIKWKYSGKDKTGFEYIKVHFITVCLYVLDRFDFAFHSSMLTVRLWCWCLPLVWRFQVRIQHVSMSKTP